MGNIIVRSKKLTETAHKNEHHTLILLMKSDTELLKKTIKRKSPGTQQKNNISVSWSSRYSKVIQYNKIYLFWHAKISRKNMIISTGTDKQLINLTYPTSQ